MTSLRTKILTSYGLSKTALLIFVAVVIADLHYLQTHIVEGQAVDDLFIASQKIRRDEKNLFLYHDPDDLKQLQKHLDVALSALTKGERVFAAIAGPEELRQLERLLETYDRKLDEYVELAPDRRKKKQEEIHATGYQLSLLTQEMDQTQRNILTKTTKVAAITLMAASITVILIGLVSALYMVRRVVRPLTELEHQLDQLAEGNVQTLIQPSNDTEIQSFVYHFNSMLEQLREQQTQTRRHERAAALGVLVSGVAHELNNPLSNISTSVQLLMEDDGTTREDLRKQWLSHIDSESDRARRIVRRLAQISTHWHTTTVTHGGNVPRIGILRFELKASEHSQLNSRTACGIDLFPFERRGQSFTRVGGAPGPGEPLCRGVPAYSATGRVANCRRRYQPSCWAGLITVTACKALFGDVRHTRMSISSTLEPQLVRVNAHCFFDLEATK